MFIDQKYKVFINNKPLYLTQSQSFYEQFEGKKAKFKSKKTLKHVIQSLESQKDYESCVVYHWDIDELFYYFRRLFKFVQAAGGVVQNDDNECLIIKRKGKWDIPKGKLDKNEAPEPAALREIEEECGVEGLEIKRFLIHTYHTYKMNGKKYLKKTWWYALHSNYSGDLIPQEDEDITEVKWIQESELDTVRLNTYISIHTVIDAFQELS